MSEIKDNGSGKNRTKKRITKVDVVRVLLAVFVVLLIISVYCFYNPPVTTAPTVQSPAETTEPAETETAETTSLPAELTDPESVTVLVNKTHPLPADYVPALSTPYVLSTGDVIQVNSNAADKLKEMIAAAEEDEVTLYLTSGYISYEMQEEYYEDRVAMVGETEANKVVAKPGYSEHQTGLAFDFSDSASGTATTTAFADTAAGQWLIAHAYEYGFILRYPDGKEAVTGYTYQPWHYRYVGTDVSNAMHSQNPNLTMEEYYGVLE